MFDGKDFQLGFAASAVGHVLVVMLFIAIGGGMGNFGGPIVYSVSIESGEKLGGVSQAPKQKNTKSIPTAVVPAKKKPPQNVSSSKEREEAEVVIKAKEVKPTPKTTPTVKPKTTPKPKATPKKPLPKPKPVAKKTTAPKPKQQKPAQVKKPVKTSSPKAAKEPSLDEINSALERAVKKYTGESTDAGGKGYGSSGEGGQGFGGGKSRPPEFFQYQETLENFVKSGWAWHDPVASLKASVCFELSPTGTLLSVRLCNSSGDRKYDESVVRAVQKADPLPAPPATVYEYFREVRMTFTPQLF